MHKRVKQTGKFSRSSDQRQAMLNRLTESLFIHGEIVTTKAKAKAVSRKAEKMITTAKKNTTGAHRQLASVLDEFALEELLEVIAPRFKNRDSGYLSLTNAGWRKGDNAKLVRVSILEDDLAKPQSMNRTQTETPASDNAQAQEE